MNYITSSCLGPQDVRLGDIPDAGGHDLHSREVVADPFHGAFDGLDGATDISLNDETQFLRPSGSLHGLGRFFVLLGLPLLALGTALLVDSFQIEEGCLYLGLADAVRQRLLDVGLGPRQDFVASIGKFFPPTDGHGHTGVRDLHGLPVVVAQKAHFGRCHAADQVLTRLEVTPEHKDRTDGTTTVRAVSEIF